MKGPYLNIKSSLSILDWEVFVGILCLTCASVVWGFIRYKHKYHSMSESVKLSEYLIMGRLLTLPLFIATLTSTWYGNIFGVTQIAFEQGYYNFVTQGIFWYVAYLLFAFLIARKIRRYQVLSLPQLIQRIFGYKSAKLSAILILFKTLPISYAISLGILIQLFFEITLLQSTILGVVFVSVYSFLGGFRAVVFSDAVQCLCMLVGLLSVIVFSYLTFGGLPFLREHLPDEHFSFTGNHSLSTTLIWFFIACSTTLINPTFYQRCFAAKTDNVAFYGILGSIVIWIIIDCCTTLGGMYAKAILPDADPTNAYIIYSLQILPCGWRGLFLAGLVATILSTLDSFLLLSSSTLFYDLTLFKNYSTKTKHMFALIVTGTLTIMIAQYFEGNIEAMWLTIEGCFSACLVFPMLTGHLFPRCITDTQFVISCLIGCFSYMFCRLLVPIYNLPIDDFYVGAFLTLLFISCFACSNYLLVRVKL